MKHGVKKEYSRHAREITLEEYRQYKEDGSDFVLVVGRPSCRYCAVVTSAVFQRTYDTPVYLLSLEPYLDTPDYGSVKKELEVTYLPSFQYVSDGNVKYHMNSPLESGYYEASGSDRKVLYRQMQEKIHAFMSGLTGEGPVINESVLSDTVHGVLESAGEGQP